MLYVIERSDGVFVARQGMPHSYVSALQDARVWKTKEAALAEVCPVNEQVVAVDDILRTNLAV